MLHVCPLSALEHTLETSRARRMVSLMGPGKELSRPPQITDAYLGLEFNDITEPRDGLIEPDLKHIRRLLDFFEGWSADQPMLIHCWMGISRSTAAALIASAARAPDQDMSALAKRLRALSPMATPNALMIHLADVELGLNGRLVNAVRAIGRGAMASEGIAFEMAVLK